MWMVLCSAADAAGIWAWEGLRQWGLTPLELVTAESLAAAYHWEHRLESGQPYLKITLRDGRVLKSTEIRAVLNRLQAPSPRTLENAAHGDREYAQAEMFAFYLSWLHAIPGAMINRPKPMGLSGAWLHASEWMLRASRAGLRTPVYRQSGRDGESSRRRQGCGASVEERTGQRVIALRGEVFGATVPARVAKACGRLAEEVDAELLGIDLYEDRRGQWVFAGATPAPDLRLGGAALLRRMAQILSAGE